MAETTHLTAALRDIKVAFGLASVLTAPARIEVRLALCIMVGAQLAPGRVRGDFGLVAGKAALAPSVVGTLGG